MAVLSAERIKITTTKSPLWCTITIIVLGLGVAWMIGRSSSSSIQAYNDEAASGTPDFEKFLPTFNEGSATISLASAPGTSLAHSNEIGEVGVRLLRSIPEVKSVGRRAGRAEKDDHVMPVSVNEFDVEFHEGGRPRDEVFAEIRARLGYLCEVGLSYLTLDRQSRTLSGGEVQRINLTTALGTSLVNTLFVLDEPSIGLHPRDMHRINEAMLRLRDAGNTLVVVEHDPAVMLAADRLIDMGPGPGERGGQIVFDGTPEARVDAVAAGAVAEHGDRLDQLPERQRPEPRVGGEQVDQVGGARARGRGRGHVVEVDRLHQVCPFLRLGQLVGHQEAHPVALDRLDRVRHPLR